MPTFKVEYQITPPHQTRDVDAKSPEEAISKVVIDGSADSSTVSVTRCIQLIESGTEGAASAGATPAAHAAKKEEPHHLHGKK